VFTQISDNNFLSTLEKLQVTLQSYTHSVIKQTFWYLLWLCK